jgi:cytidylate kinase
VIAIDGPAGAGKTTVAKRLAQDLGLNFLDTGAMYRCIALKAKRLGVMPEEAEAAAQIAESSSITFGPGDPQRVYVDGEDVTEAIRQPEIGDLASAISVHSAVRTKLVESQKQIVGMGGVTLEGRDTTTVIAPNAPVRVFLNASSDVRALRRFQELQAKRMDVDFEQLRSQIEERDHRDTTRAHSPLTIAPGVQVINTNSMSIDDVVEAVKRLADGLA